MDVDKSIGKISQFCMTGFEKVICSRTILEWKQLEKEGKRKSLFSVII
jgi:hypothetical protein